MQDYGVPTRSHGWVKAQCNTPGRTVAPQHAVIAGSMLSANTPERCQVGPKDASRAMHSSRELVSGVSGAPFTDSVHRMPCLIVDGTIRHWICKFARLVPAHAVGFMSTTPTAVVLVQCKFQQY
jgi:hypothetical protein